MGRKSTKSQRLDAMTQWQQRKFKRKNSPKGKKEGSWADRFFKELKLDVQDDSNKANDTNE